jgi:hypothetical protein
MQIVDAQMHTWGLGLPNNPTSGESTPAVA